ncbi:hypothetical protein RhiirA5_366511 [Rhizophagus irregularis]|uniref:Uncharacterized protein n=1 Tax=Rhizophagus irregularis TaxID=588596 RepID=A0A2N0R777_9GLOM|nr:hypothetical protein RhiirA5_366511 [Rhizophagus irregularis]PKC59159.1 hypothetical protein RhiirA1_427161 [Rhizophagus irregularis]
MYLAFGVKDDANVGAAFIDALQITTCKVKQLSAGVNKEMIRGSVGYEHMMILKKTLQLRLKKLKKSNNILDFYSRNFIFTFR